MTATMNRGPLDGVRVLDVSNGIAGPLATMILGDFGAEVIRIDARATIADALPGVAQWHRNKTVVAEGEQSRSLAADADIVVTTDARSADQLDLPLDEDHLNGAVVHLHVPLWNGAGPGNREPLDAMTADRMVQASYGIARRQTSFSGGPVECVYPFASYLQGTWGATAAIAALVERATTGLGQRVVINPRHGAIVTATTTMFADPAVTPPTTSVGPGGPNPAFGTYQCSDGEWLFLGALGVKFQDIAFARLGVSDIVEHPRVAANREAIYAVDLRDQVRARIAEGFRRKPRAQWIEELASAGCPVSPVVERDDWLDHPQVIAMGQRVEFDDLIVGTVVAGGVPVSFSAQPNSIPRPRTIVENATWRPRTSVIDAPAEARAADAVLPGRGPLHGIRVLDLGTVLAGPYAGQLLAALGADVVKVETPRGDEFRVRGYMINRGQRSLSIDLRDPSGHAAFMQLVATSDVVVDNFRPGVRTRLGIDLEALRAANPRIVSTSITGYGAVGPMGDQPGYDPVVQALSGIMRAQGGEAEPVFCTVSVNDVTSACLAALGTCAALYQRVAGGVGQEVSTSLAAAAVFMQSNELVRYPSRPQAEIGGRDYQGPSPLSRYYPCVDGWARLHLPSAAAAVAVNLAHDAGLEDQALSYAIAFQTATMTAEDLDTLVSSVGGTATKARDNAEFLLNAPTGETDDIGVVTWPDGNRSYLPRAYGAFSRHPVNPMMTTPGMGEHSREVLAEAGLSEAVVDDLIAAGIVVDGEPMLTVAGTGYR